MPTSDRDRTTDRLSNPDPRSAERSGTCSAPRADRRPAAHSLALGNGQTSREARPTNAAARRDQLPQSLNSFSIHAQRVPTAKRRSRKWHPSVDGLERRALLSIVNVSGEANIYGAGLTVPRTQVAAAAASCQSERQPLSPGKPGSRRRSLQPAARSAARAAEGGYNGPDGGPYWGGVTNVPAYGGISGVQDTQATMFLVGVFLGPDGQPATPPATLNVTNANNLTSFSPLIGQQFFIGDGRIGRSGSSRRSPCQQVRPVFSWGSPRICRFSNPERLPGYYSDNGGSLTVDVEPNASAPAHPHGA